LKVETIHFDKIGDLQFTVYRQKQIIIFFPIEKTTTMVLKRTKHVSRQILSYFV